MENLVGKNNALSKSYCLKTLLILYHKSVVISDLIYVLSCLELIDEKGNKNKILQSYNPMLFIKKNVLKTLKKCFNMNLLYVNNHFLKITEEGKIIISNLISINDLDISTYLKKIEIIKDQNYNEIYNKMINKEE